MKYIELTRGQKAIVDDEDYNRLMLHSWAINPEGNGYAVRKGSKRKGEPRTVAMHREILHAPPGTQIDHINRNSLDNRKENLRYVNTQQNAFNRSKVRTECTSIYKGVFKRWNKSKWTARIRFNGRRIELGCYNDEEKAAAVYNFASRIFFGEYRAENTQDEVEELTYSEQINVFERCQRYIERYGWYVSTDSYRYYLNCNKDAA